MDFGNLIRLTPKAESFAGDLSALEQTAGVYMLWAGAAAVHLSWSTNLGRRLKRLLGLGPGQRQGTKALGESIDAVECWPVGSRLEMQILLHRLAKRHYPDRYLKLLKLRMPWLCLRSPKTGSIRLERCL